MSHKRGAFLTVISYAMAFFAMAMNAYGDTITSDSKSVVYKAPLVISTGGIYKGNWESVIPNVPAITVNTTAAVVIEDCRLRGKSHMIRALLSGTNITVKNCIAQGLNPDVLDGETGRFVTVFMPAKLVIENNTLLGTAGIYVDGAGKSNEGITIRYNKALNIEGRLSNGVGGYSSKKFLPIHFTQLNSVRATDGIEIAWNEVINEPRRSRVEDNINIYRSSGTADSPILIHDNYIQGAYPNEPLTDNFSGGGIITDGDVTTLAEATGYVRIYNNQVVNTNNYGIGIASGHHVLVWNNHVISTGKLPDGNRIASANVGLYVSVNPKSPAEIFVGNSVAKNTVGWLNAKGVSSPWWFPSCQVGMCAPNTMIIPTEAWEKTEFIAWQIKLSNAKTRVGSNLTSGQEVER